MKLYLKQKVFSWRGRFFVKDQEGYDRYAAEGELFSLGHRLRVYDADGREVALIRQKIMSFMPRFIVDINGQEVFEIVQKFAFFRHNFRLNGLPWYLSGDFWGHEYSLDDESGRRVMYLSKQWFTWGDSYELHITDPKEELLCLCVALAVDCALCARSRS